MWPTQIARLRSGGALANWGRIGVPPPEGSGRAAKRELRRDHATGLAAGETSVEADDLGRAPDLSIYRMPKRSTRPSPDALSQEAQELLRVHRSNPLRLVSRENSRLEYKRSFNWNGRANYAKTMAAFANNDGGFIVFGVDDSPHDMVGVDVERFESLDSARIAEYLNSTFVPEIAWERFCIGVSESQLGVLAVTPAVTRPIVCIKDDGKALREADIYYRYRGRTARIRYSELQQLLVEGQERERAAWLNYLKRVARIGVENVGLLDFVDGELSGQGGRLLVSEDLLQKVKVIREGRFTERHGGGAPTLRLVGDVQAVSPEALRPIKTIARPLVIGEKEIMVGFLRQARPPAPTEYLKQACRESSGYMPVYFFAQAAGLESDALRAFVTREASRRNGLRERVDGRLVTPVGSLAATTASSKERESILEALQGGNVSDLRHANRVRLFEAVTHFEPSSPPAGLLGLLKEVVENDFDQLTSSERSLYRKAVARLDEVLHRPKSEEHGS